MNEQAESAVTRTPRGHHLLDQDEWDALVTLIRWALTPEGKHHAIRGAELCATASIIGGAWLMGEVEASPCELREFMKAVYSWSIANPDDFETLSELQCVAFELAQDLRNQSDEDLS